MSKKSGTSGNVAEPADTEPAEGRCLHRSAGVGSGAARALPPASLWPGDKDEVIGQVRTWTSHHSAPRGGISKKTVEKRREVTAEALGAALLAMAPSWDSAAEIFLVSG